MRKESHYIVVVAIILAAIVVWALLPASSLDILERDSKRLLAAIPADYGETITIWYMHSIVRRPVLEMLHLEPDGSLMVDGTIYDMNGTGLPYAPEPGEKFELKDGKYILSNMNRVFPEVVLAVGWVAKHKLIIRDRTLPLANVTPPGTAIRLRVGKHPRWFLWCTKARWLALSEPTPKS